ncbi:MAG: hypothetical protein WC479_07315 [Candidatus Izemoplasmatales bacterium]
MDINDLARLTGLICHVRIKSVYRTECGIATIQLEFLDNVRPGTILSVNFIEEASESSEDKS